MSLFNRRSDVWYPEENKSTDEIDSEIVDLGETKEEIPTIMEGEICYSKLITAQDNAEASVIKSILQASNIPYAIRDGESEAWKRVMMGYSVFGSDFYVPTEMLDAATALLVPDEEEADGADAQGENAGSDADAADEKPEDKVNA